MNRKAIIGTIVWSLILFILISAFIFYVTYRNRDSNVENKILSGDEEIVLEEISNKLAMEILTTRQGFYYLS